MIFGVRAFVIEPVTPNAIMYIRNIFLTQDGTNTAATGVSLDGTAGNGRFKTSVTIDALRNVDCVGTNQDGTLTTGNCLSYTGIDQKRCSLKNGIITCDEDMPL